MDNNFEKDTLEKEVAYEKFGASSDVLVKGFFRVAIEENGEIVGDSGFRPNIVVNDGFLNFLVQRLGNIAGSTYVTHVNVGEGTVPGAADNSLNLEVSGTNNTNQRQTVTAAAQGSTTVRFTATMSSANSFVTATETITNVGLFGHSDLASLFAGNIYTGSTVATNQNVNITYDIDFS
jgi:hypothetical protein